MSQVRGGKQITVLSALEFLVKQQVETTKQLAEIRANQHQFSQRLDGLLQLIDPSSLVNSSDSTVSEQIKVLSSKLDAMVVPLQAEKEVEATISYQLGRTLIDSSKSVGELAKLPSKLFSLKRETERRQRRQLEKLVNKTKTT